MQRTSWKGI